MYKQAWTYTLPYNLTIKGFSKGSQNTGFIIPELKVMFDAQMRSDSCTNNIFITHGHSDHIFALPMRICHVSKQPIVCVPNEIVDMTKKFIDSVFQLGYYDSTYNYECNIVGVRENDIININSSYRVKVYDLDHNVPCRGYGIQRVRTKLMQKYLNTPKQDIIKLKEQKISITEEIVENVFAYLTDTTPTIFSKYSELLTYKVIMTECTFLPINDPENENIEKSHEVKHTHWNDLYPIIVENEQTHFILMHFSCRYSDDELRKFRDTIELKNITFVI